MSKFIQDIRGKVNSEISNEFASHLGAMVGHYVGRDRYVLIGRDASTASQMIKKSITSGLMSTGVNVMEFSNTPLPVINYSKKFYDANVVITVSESHLREEDVNIKIISSHEIPLDQRYSSLVPWYDIGKVRYVSDLESAYREAVIENAAPEIKKKNFLLVIDCAHETGNSPLPGILDDLGCETVYIGCSEKIPQRDFPEPSPQRLSLISELVFAAGADMGVYLDNDHDRIILISEKGDLINDQEAIAIFARAILEENPGQTIVSSVVVSHALDEVVKKYKGKLFKTSVNQVLNEIMEKKAIFGGDEPGMFVFPQFQDCFDGIYALVMMLGILAKGDYPISTLVQKVPKYYRTIFTVECEHEKKMNVLNKFKKDYESKYKLLAVDGLRVDLDDSFVLIRPSRFEPLLRVYIESKSPEKLQILIKGVKKNIEDISI